MRVYGSFIKPLLDYIIALVLFIVLLPVMLALVVSLMVFNNGEVFFVQQRVGRNEKLFYLLKFKTLKDKYDAHGQMLPDLERQYAFGNFLRHYHLDELPQLINVLRAELSLIGPRPLLVSYLPLYNARQRKRHSVKPGMIGLAQLLGGNTLSWSQRLRLDIFYVNKYSIIMDVKIVLMAINYFIRKKNAHHPSSLFSESFAEYCSRSISATRQ